MIQTVDAGLTLDRAYRVCREITTSHYENFPVASLLLPAKIRRHVYPVYAFARCADDLADEAGDRDALLQWRELLYRSSQETPDHPVFMALRDTMRKFALPLSLFDDLLSAFLQDLEKNRYADLPELLEYCRHSANPVGRIILLLHGYREERLFAHSDAICSALQLVNFWQDLSIDLQKNRLYIPRSFLEAYRIDEEALFQKVSQDNFREMLKALIETTRGLFRQGFPLLRSLGGRLKWELKFTVLGGLAVLDKIEKLDYNVLQSRPALTKGDWARIAIEGIVRNLGNVTRNS